MSTHHHLQPERETDPGFSFSDSSKIKAPAKVWLSLMFTVAARATAWATLRMSVSEHAARLAALETDSRSGREVLIRIDERTAEIKRRLDQPPAR
jgi:hypothetical protein